MGPWHDWVMVTFAEDGEDDIVEDVMEQNDDRYFKDDEFLSNILYFLLPTRNQIFMQLFNHVLVESLNKIQYYCSIGRRNMSEYCIKVMHALCMLFLLNHLANAYLLWMIQL